MSDETLLMPFPDGFLRDSVLVDSTPSSIELRFSVWSIKFPRSLLESSKNISAFFRREISSIALADECNDVRNIVLILSYQGCLIPKFQKDSYRLSDVKAVHVSFCNEFYGYYYSHRLWSSMRADVIPVETIRQWVSRTYFLSRFAGVTASAASQNGPTAEVCTAFLKSAVEEYSHCEDYYLPPATLFSTDLGYIEGIAPAPCFIAFDQQMLYIAKEDWLAHLFVALFQERTAQFKNGAYNLYSRVETQLGMPGMLDGWRTHISFDEENSHESDLDSLFKQEIEVSKERLQDALDETSLAVEILIDGLDTVHYLGARGINPRAYTENNILKSHHLDGIRCLSDVSEYVMKASNPAEVVIELTILLESTPLGLKFITAAERFFSRQVELCAVTLLTMCLENCETHDEIIRVGMLLEISRRCNLECRPAPNALEMANRVIWNYFSFKARRPSECLFNLFILISLLEVGSRNSNGSLEKKVTVLFKDALILTTHRLCAPHMTNEFLNEALSTLAILEYAFEMDSSSRLPRRLLLGCNSET